MSGREITITAADGGEFMGYLAAPASGGGAGVVVIQEIFGVNGVMRGITDGLAGEGFMALCPDLFWRQEPGIQITDQTDEEWARAFELFQGFDLKKASPTSTARSKPCAASRAVRARWARWAFAWAGGSPI